MKFSRLKHLFLILLFFSAEFSLATLANAQQLNPPRDELWQYYFEIKAEVSKKALNLPYEIEEVEGGKRIWTSDCGFTKGIDFKGVTNESMDLVGYWQGELFDTAKYIILFRRAVIKAKYPENTWREDLIKLEEKYVNLIFQSLTDANAKKRLSEGTSEWDRLLEKLNKYAASANPKLLFLVSADGCGAGDFQIDLSTQPRAQKIRLIPDFFAQLCLKKSNNQEISSCVYWKDFPSSSSISVSGAYQFEAVWNDGTIRRGKIDFDKLKRDKDDVKRFRISK
jgi:hypothetical protein